MNKLRQDLRRTTTAQERQEAQAKQQKLQSELDIRNAQISELQQQILGIEQDKEKESKQDKWTKLSSMVEAKLAVQYLFEQATDSMAAASAKTTELKEVTLQYEELRVVRNELKEEILKMKMNHEDEVVRLEREHEEKILFLLRQEGCTCLGGCMTMKCSCRKAGPNCSALCKCDSSKCSNR